MLTLDSTHVMKLTAYTDYIADQEEGDPITSLEVVLSNSWEKLILGKKGMVLVLLFLSGRFLATCVVIGYTSSIYRRKFGS